MKHEPFTVEGFEFMNEPATDDQKDLICQIAARKGRPIHRDGAWPVPFTRYDAARMIDALEAL